MDKEYWREEFEIIWDIKKGEKLSPGPNQYSESYRNFLIREARDSEVEAIPDSDEEVQDGDELDW